MAQKHVPTVWSSSTLLAHLHKRRVDRQQPPQRPWAVPCRCSSKRTPKDPRMYRDMEELRADLHSRDSTSPGFIAGGLNQIGRDAFGSERCCRPSEPMALCSSGCARSVLV